MSKQTQNTKDNKKATVKETKIDKPEVFPELVGFGKFEFQNKILYIGSYKQLTNGSKIREGKGKIIHPSNDNSEYGQEFYDGDWKDDKMNGFGIYNYSSGDKYEGEWRDNQHHGHGKYIFTDGSFYEGEWREHKMHGTGKYCDMNNVNWVGEFREGQFISKEQAKLKEEKRIQKKIMKMKEVPFTIFYKSWEETFVKVDKKNSKDLLSPFFAKLENMGVYIKENYPKFEDKTPDKWNEAIKLLFGISNSNNATKEGIEIPKPVINVPKSSIELSFMNKDSLLTPQLQEELSSGQVIEISTTVENRKINLGIAYNRELNKWLIVYFNEIIEKKK